MADAPGRTVFPTVTTAVEDLQKGDVVAWGDEAFKTYVARRGTVSATYEVLFLDGTRLTQLPAAFTFDVLDPTFLH